MYEVRQPTCLPFVDTWTSNSSFFEYFFMSIFRRIQSKDTETHPTLFPPFHRPLWTSHSHIRLLQSKDVIRVKKVYIETSAYLMHVKKWDSMRCDERKRKRERERERGRILGKKVVYSCVSPSLSPPHLESSLTISSSTFSLFLFFLLPLLLILLLLILLLFLGENFSSL